MIDITKHYLLYTRSMTEILHANIFFVITSIAVIVFMSVLLIALYHIIKIIKSLRRIIERIEAGSERIVEDMDDVRQFVRDSNPIAQILRFAMSFRRPPRRGRRTKADESNEDY